MQMYVIRSKSLLYRTPQYPHGIFSLRTATVQLSLLSHLLLTYALWFAFALRVQSLSVMQHEVPRQLESPSTTAVTLMTFISGHLKLS